MNEKSSDKSITFIYKWQIQPINGEEGFRSDWIESDSFGLFDNSAEHLFRILSRYHINDYSYEVNIKVKKRGFPFHGKTDIEIRYKNVAKNMTMIKWNGDLSDTLTFLVSKSCSFPWHLHCKITLHKLDSDIKSIMHSSMLANHADDYLLSSELSDVIVKVENEEFPAHKLVLASHSPVFRRMFSTDMKEAKENCVNFKNFETEVIKEVLKFIYTGKVEAEDDTELVLSVLACANMYQIDKLKIFCECKLIENINLDNVINLLVKTDNYEVPRLKERAMKFLVNNKANISFDDAINQVSNSKIIREFFISQMGMKCD
ncbi:speckle-type POZ protein B-like [Microplitis mediator]|uniref:speckle-type POZ protein B-like n=1 Tax=Microplitis mediator TaxID=375433 RepID=UPI0025532738|nr:speckle-type POZ protein B-like [Microplitis mediator]XP_057326197.1 speckle-type POZ protein B-like [Microplitis mediator]